MSISAGKRSSRRRAAAVPAFLLLLLGFEATCTVAARKLNELEKTYTAVAAGDQDRAAVAHDVYDEATVDTVDEAAPQNGTRRLLATTCSGRTYTVKKGDTCWDISQAYGVPVSTILASNPSVNSGCTNLRIGQVLCLGPSGDGGSALYSGSGAGTYYYDLKTRCPQDTWGYPENNGYPACASWTPGASTYKTLAQLGSNNVVAIDGSLLSTQAGRAKYCGKKVQVYKNNVLVKAPDGGEFFVWDGCEACVGGGRIDFSVSGLKNVDSNACNLGVVPGVSWRVVDKVVRKFVP